MLYLALHVDLRARFVDSEWLVYSNMVLEQTYTSKDIVVLSEYVVKERAEMIQAIYHIKNQGARIIYVGSAQNAPDEWKQQLVMLGVLDFYFVEGENLILGYIDELIENPRTIKDVKKYLPVIDNQTLPTMPTIVDEFIENKDELTAQVAASTEIDANEAPATFLEKLRENIFHRGSKDEGEAEFVTPLIPNTPAKKTTVVWKNPEPITVCILGDRGAGRSFVAWNIAALCNQKGLPSVVVESDTQCLSHWIDPLDGVHINDNIPHKGYRVNIVTDTSKVKDADLYIVVTFPDLFRIKRLSERVDELSIPKERTVWIVNNHLAEIPLQVELASDFLIIPHEPRQMGAVRMKTPLVLSDSSFSNLLEPLITKISNLFIDKAEGGKAHVAAAGI